MVGVLIRNPRERGRDAQREGWPREDGGREKSDAATSQGTPGVAVCPLELGRSMEHSPSELSENTRLCQHLAVGLSDLQNCETVRFFFFFFFGFKAPICVMVALGDEYPLF